MQIRLWFLLGLLLTVGSLRGGDSLGAARRARALLGPEAWSQVLRIENISRASRYPRVVHALAFEFADRLWFYTDVDGTQSLSLHRGQLVEEKADLGPLLRAIDPGFVHWSVAPDAPDAPVKPGPVPNGCFLESFAAWRARRAAGEVVARAQLLTFYVETPSGPMGHTVLTFTEGSEVKVIDPLLTKGPMAFPGALANDALALARMVHGGDVRRARLLRLEEPHVPWVATNTGGDATESTKALREVVTVR